MLRKIQNAEDIWKLVQETGFLPLFQNEIKGFSIEECTPPSLWFSDTKPGPWGELKKKCNYVKGGNKGFETVITRLQMEAYLVVEDFEYMRDKAGNTYGWGVARYSTPERLAGEDFFYGEYKKEPELSRKAVYGHIKRLFPEVSEKQLVKLFK